MYILTCFPQSVYVWCVRECVHVCNVCVTYEWHIDCVYIIIIDVYTHLLSPKCVCVMCAWVCACVQCMCDVWMTYRLCIHHYYRCIYSPAFPKVCMCDVCDVMCAWVWRVTYEWHIDCVYTHLLSPKARMVAPLRPIRYPAELLGMVTRAWISTSSFIWRDGDNRVVTGG